MFRSMLVGLTVVLVGTSAVLAAPADDVIAAAKKLSESGYAWKTTTENAGGNNNRGPGGTQGKIEKEGLTQLNLKMGDNTTLVIFKGEKGAIKSGDGDWQSLAEAAKAGGDQPGPGRFIANITKNFKAPAAQAESAAAKVKELKKTDDGFSGDLTEEGVKEMLAFGRRAAAAGGANAPQITNAKGTAMFVVKDGVLAKIRYTVQATMSFNGQDREIDRTTTVEITDVGSTKIEVPADAKSKME